MDNEFPGFEGKWKPWWGIHFSEFVGLERASLQFKEIRIFWLPPFRIKCRTILKWLWAICCCPYLFVLLNFVQNSGAKIEFQLSVILWSTHAKHTWFVRLAYQVLHCLCYESFRKYLFQILMPFFWTHIEF